MTEERTIAVTASMYQTLSTDSQEIRLLVLEPGQRSDPLAGRLITGSLLSASPLEYETVSYAWGNSFAVTEMRLDGMPTSVPTSSAAALKILRLADRERILWIDAICINQRDLDEKADQVKIMSAIYRSGSLNLIVLGDDDENVADQIIHAIDVLGDHLMRLQAEATPQQLAALQRHSPDDRFRSPQTLAMLSALQPLFSAVWFTRIWVLQEMVSARKSQCHWGDHVVPFMKLLNILYCFSMVPGATEHVKRLWSMEAHKSYTCAAWMASLLPHLRHYRLPVCNEIFLISASFSSSIPHDKIYALLAIIKAELPHETIARNLLPDYRKPPLELYRDATRFVLQHSIVPFILGNVSHRSVADMTQEGKTSWTWLWGRDFDGNLDPRLIGHALNSTRPTSDTVKRFDIKDTGDPNILAVTGFVVDAIEWVLPMRSPDVQGTARRLQAFVRRCHSVAESEDEAKIILSQVLIFGNGTMAIPKFADREQARLAYESWIERSAKDTSSPGEEDSRPVDLFETHFRQAASERSVFTTSNGFIGIGPKITSEGDVLALFVGGNSASVLRPSGDLYYYVGAAYTYQLTESKCSERGLIPTLIKLR